MLSVNTITPRFLRAFNKDTSTSTWSVKQVQLSQTYIQGHHHYEAQHTPPGRQPPVTPDELIKMWILWYKQVIWYTDISKIYYNSVKISIG